uniref:Uncharacterized protein n=1 Tax=Helianthus annuus TaxID=4232 RepID=A0A251VIE8_HELAN
MQEANAHISNGTTDLEKSQLSLDKVLRESSIQAPNAMHEVSQHAVQNNVEIHLEEPLTVNKDVLTDGQQRLLFRCMNRTRFLTFALYVFVSCSLFSCHCFWIFGDDNVGHRRFSGPIFGSTFGSNGSTASATYDVVTSRELSNSVCFYSPLRNQVNGSG